MLQDDNPICRVLFSISLTAARQEASAGGTANDTRIFGCTGTFGRVAHYKCVGIAHSGLQIIHTQLIPNCSLDGLAIRVLFWRR